MGANSFESNRRVRADLCARFALNEIPRKLECNPGQNTFS